MGSRALGQQVELLLVLNGVIQANLTAIKDFEYTYDMSEKDDGFLGETTNRKDAVFTGISGKFSFHHEKAATFAIFQQIVDKARRRVAGVVINIKASVQYDDGSRARVILPNVEFGNIPVNVGGRVEFVNSTLSFKGSEARVLS